MAFRPFSGVFCGTTGVQAARMTSFGFSFNPRNCLSWARGHQSGAALNVLGSPFDRRVEEMLVDRDDVAPIVRPMLAAWRQLRVQIAAFDKAVRSLTKSNPTCRLLMSVPGIGVLSVLAYVSSVEDPTRFSRSVGAHFGLTPKQYQSGEIDRSGRISKYGDSLTRTLMYEAATVLLRWVKRPSSLQDWAQAIARRSGEGKARVALARKHSVILHSIWRSGEPFRWSELQVAA